MAGLRDRFQRSQQFALAAQQWAQDDSLEVLPGPRRSAAQRVQHIGFSVHGPDQPSAWKRRLGVRTTAPTETTLRAMLLTRCALAHSLGALLLTGIATVLFLESNSKSWLWLILFSMLLVVYGVAAYWYVAHVERFAVARWLILGGDLLALACLWLMIGPSMVLVLLWPCLILLAALLADRRAATLTALLGGGLLALLSLADLAGMAHLAFHLRPAVVLLLNLLGALACLGWITLVLLVLLARSERHGGVEHWNSAQIARVRIESDIHTRQLQDELETLQSAVSLAAAGDGRARAAIAAIKDGELAPLAGRLTLLLDRQEQSFEVGQQHRRLERAVVELVALLEALHRGERVGWPLPSGTPVDRILALMRAPANPSTTRKLSQPAQDDSSPLASVPFSPVLRRTKPGPTAENR